VSGEPLDQIADLELALVSCGLRLQDTAHRVTTIWETASPGVSDLMLIGEGSTYRAALADVLEKARAADRSPDAVVRTAAKAAALPPWTWTVISDDDEYRARRKHFTGGLSTDRWMRYLDNLTKNERASLMRSSVTTGLSQMKYATVRGVYADDQYTLKPAPPRSSKSPRLAPAVLVPCWNWAKKLVDDGGREWKQFTGSLSWIDDVLHSWDAYYRALTAAEKENLHRLAKKRDVRTTDDLLKLAAQLPQVDESLRRTVCPRCAGDSGPYEPGRDQGGATYEETLEDWEATPGVGRVKAPRSVTANLHRFHSDLGHCISNLCARLETLEGGAP